MEEDQPSTIGPGALRESEERFRKILEIETVGVIFWNIEGRIADANGAFLRMIDHDLAEAMGLSWRDLTPEEFVPPSENAMWEIANLGEITPYEKQYYRKDGSTWWGLFAARRLTDKEFVEFVLDVTDRKEAEVRERETREAAEAAQAEAEEANRTKATFLATMSHELRTPLNAIIGYSDLLDAEIAGPLNAAQKEQLGRIDIGARHLLQIIEEILTFSRIEAGREEVQMQPVDLADLARESCRLLEPLAATKSLDLTCHTPGSLLIETDPGKVRQILLNLLSNAVKFTEIGHVLLEVRSEGDEAVLRTIDTGIGIPLEQQERIFEPFSQIGQALSRQKGGTGLGLSVTQQLARLLGGEIEVESTPGEGSAFTVRLPATRT